MSIYSIQNDKIVALERTAFDRQGLREKQNLQKMLKSQIHIISPDTLVVAEEFGEWEDSRRRIDLLGIDKNANLVVIELKRTEDGGHMELQSIRYAAMISTLTFDKLVQIYARYLADNGIQKDAKESLLSFLVWQEPDDDQFGQEVKIVLASTEFSKEITTSVMWLNDFGLDIRCVRMHPYISGSGILLDVQTVIPIPEVADYQVRIREKKQKEREARSSSRYLTKFNLKICGNLHESLSKRGLMFHIISSALKQKITPQNIMDAIPERKKILFEIFDGILDARQVHDRIMQDDTNGVYPRVKRFFADDGEFFHHDGKTYVLSNQWGNGTLEAVASISKKFPQLDIEITPLN